MERLEDVYRNAYLAWNNVFSDFGGIDKRFGTSPVKDAYWKFCPAPGPYIWREKIIPRKNERMNLITHPIPTYVQEMFGKNSVPEKNPHTMVFRRYENLEHGFRPYEMDILLSSFLGIPQFFGVKINSNHAILNDSWTINLKTTRENVMMDAFLKGFGTEFENLKHQWCNTPPHTERKMGIDVGEELKDLFKVYTDASAHLESKERMALNHLVHAMESFLSVHKEKIKVDNKLTTLKYKLQDNGGCACDEDEDDDEDE